MCRRGVAFSSYSVRSNRLRWHQFPPPEDNDGDDDGDEDGARSHLDKSGVFFAPVFYDTLRYAKKVSEPPPRCIMTGGARLAISDTHKHHTYRKIYFPR